MNLGRGITLARLANFGLRCNGIRNKCSAFFRGYRSGPYCIDHKGVRGDAMMLGGCNCQLFYVLWELQ